MKEVRNEATAQGGEYLIQDCDHLGESRQVGGQAGVGEARQADQGQSANRDQGSQSSESGQQGGERRTRRPKLL